MKKTTPQCKRDDTAPHPPPAPALRCFFLAVFAAGSCPTGQESCSVGPMIARRAQEVAAIVTANGRVPRELLIINQPTCAPCAPGYIDDGVDPCCVSCLAGTYASSSTACSNCGTCGGALGRRLAQAARSRRRAWCSLAPHRQSPFPAPPATPLNPVNLQATS